MTHGVVAARDQAPERYPVYLSFFREVRSEERLMLIVDRVARVIFSPDEEAERAQGIDDMRHAIEAERIDSLEKFFSSQFLSERLGAPRMARLKDKIIVKLAGEREDRLLTDLYPARDYTEEQAFEVFDQVSRELDTERDQEEWDETMKRISYADLPLLYLFYGLTVLADAPRDVKEYVSRKWKKNAPIIANKVHALARNVMEMKKYPQAVAGSVVRGVNGIGKHPVAAVATAVACVAVPIVVRFFFYKRDSNSRCCNFHFRNCGDVLKNVQIMEKKL